MRRWQNISDYRAYADRVLSGESAISSIEQLDERMKRAERIALSLRTSDGVPVATLDATTAAQTQEFIALGLLCESNGNFILTRSGKSVADSVAEAFV
jgi:coproporphyrinogen III oxidase-like Fe-S oxidoreductase